MLDTTHSYEATLRAESVARRKRLNVGRVPIQPNPAPSPSSDGHLRLIAEPEGSGELIVPPCEPAVALPAPEPEPISAPMPPRYPRVEEIQRAAAWHYNVSRIDMLSARRDAEVVRPRQVAMYVAKLLTLRSLPDIGRRFGNRDHTTVLHAVRKIANLIKEDEHIAADVEVIRVVVMRSIPADLRLGERS